MKLVTDWIQRRRGDAATEFDRLVSPLHEAAFRHCMRLSRDRADAEDLLQEAYVRAFRFFDRYDRELPFGAWLYRIIATTHIDMVRRKRRLAAQSLDAAADGRALEIADPEPNVGDRLDRGAFDAPMERALAALKPEFRTAMLLADVEGLSYEEIAETTGVSVGTVRSRIHRGRKALRERLLAAGSGFAVPARYVDGEANA